MIANKNNIFNKIGYHELSIDEISTKTGFSTERLEIFLDNLVSMGLLNKKNKSYSNTDLAKQFLVSGGTNYLGNLVELERHVYQELITENKMEYALSGGTNRFPKVDPQIYMDAMEYGVRFASLNMAKKVQKYIYPKKILDLGGGPGEVAVTFCRVFPEAEAFVYDLPEMLQCAEANIRKNNFESRIKLIEGDCLYGEYGKDYDLIVISNLLHFFNLIDIKNILQYVNLALLDGGLLIIHDFFVDPESDSSKIAYMSALDWLALGVVFNYTIDDMKCMLNDYGLCCLEANKLPMVPTSLVVARKS